MNAPVTAKECDVPLRRHEVALAVCVCVAYLLVLGTIAVWCWEAFAG